MNTISLTLNVLNFAHRKQKLTCYLSTSPKTDSVKLSLRDTSYFVEKLTLPSDTECLYTTIDKVSKEGHKVTLNTYRSSEEDYQQMWSLSFLKKYYTYRIASYFSSLGLPVKTNFVTDLDVWVLDKSPFSVCNGYRVFNIRVQFGKITKNPELVISWGGIHSVHKESISSLAEHEISPEDYSWVLFENKLFKHEDMPDAARRNQDQVYPCLNKRLQKTLRIAPQAPDKSNRYIRYWNEMESFKKTYLLTTTFQEIIPLTNTEWAKVDGLQLPKTQEMHQSLVFGGGNTDSEPKNGMKNYGPKELTPSRKIIFFFICHNDHSAMAMTVNDFMLGKKEGFKGIAKYANLEYNTLAHFSMVFQNKENPLPEIIEKLNKRNFERETRYVALYLSPFGKWDANEAHKAIYYKVKEELLHWDIVSQAIEVDKNWTSKQIDAEQKAIVSDNFKYAFANIAIALLAKLGGTPWSLKNKEFNELVIGISAFKSESLDKQYLGSAFSFSGEGKFHGFDCFRSNQTSELAGSILKAVKEYCDEHKALGRLIIHFYKKLSWKELAPIEKGLAELGLDIPVIVVSMNKTFSEDVLGFDIANEQKMPFSGTYLPIGDNQYLLYNSGLIAGTVFNAREGYPFPIKVSMQYFSPQSKVSMPVEANDIPELLHQICQFSQLYWKSVSKQSLPVTLKYPEMLAQIVPHFSRPELPRTGKETLWFL